jgi:hypothetical protein
MRRSLMIRAHVRREAPTAVRMWTRAGQPATTMPRWACAAATAAEGSDEEQSEQTKRRTRTTLAEAAASCLRGGPQPPRRPARAPPSAFRDSGGARGRESTRSDRMCSAPTHWHWQRMPRRHWHWQRRPRTRARRVRRARRTLIASLAAGGVWCGWGRGAVVQQCCGATCSDQACRRDRVAATRGGKSQHGVRPLFNQAPEKGAVDSVARRFALVGSRSSPTVLPRS